MDNFYVGQKLLCIKQPKYSEGNLTGIVGQDVIVTEINHDGSPRIQFLYKSGMLGEWNFWKIDGSWECLIPLSEEGLAKTAKERVLAKIKKLEEAYKLRMKEKVCA